MTLRRLTHRAFLLRCLVCGKDHPFPGLFLMHRDCRSCGYRYEREPGQLDGDVVR